ncbi:MAG: MBL fold metallo-hydrolase [Paludibacteraceae bacterium]|nr:MBL fold metallo-hydrolase [Paludibacteraceae bacterium]
MRMKTIIIILGFLLLLVVAVLAVFHHPAFGPYSLLHRTSSRCIASPNYRDGMFQNEEPTPQFTGNKSPITMLWEFVFSRPKDLIPSQALPAVKTDLKNIPTDRDWLVWFGHSSYLFCLNGKRYLVDPLLKMEFPALVMMKPFKGTDIYTPEDMPDIDVLIITHEHWDHLDYASVRDLRPKVKHVVCPLGIAEYLEYWKYEPSTITEMDWAESLRTQTAMQNVTITCLPSRHFSNRLLGSRNQTLWASFLIEDGGRKVYIGGDGGYDGRFKHIREQFGQVDLAILENGQYNEEWKYIHTTPQGLEQAILDLQAQAVLTVHHDKFALAKHPWFEPDSVAHAIAHRHDVRLLDQPIGTVVFF